MRTCSILLVNDDPQVIASIHEALAAARHRLIVGPTTKAAMSALNEERCLFDVLLVDLAGGFAGFVLFDIVHTCCPRLPVIALLPSEEWLLEENAFLRGTAGLVDKPVRAKELADALQAACGCAGRRSLPKARRMVNPIRGIRR